uniref:RRM domain-containing protein n=1 Tax=Salix viminalis TaxID=40686 RepID=A0A6N2KDK8_SALVM
MRSIFCGNFEYDARQTELERLFKRYGRVERVDMKAATSRASGPDSHAYEWPFPFIPVVQQLDWDIQQTMIVLGNIYSSWLMDGCSEFCSFPVTSILLFSRKVTLIRNGRTMPIFLRHYCLSFLMTFAQPSIPDMFQYRNIVDLTAEAAE